MNGLRIIYTLILLAFEWIRVIIAEKAKAIDLVYFLRVSKLFWVSTIYYLQLPKDLEWFSGNMVFIAIICG